jgi:hypothetical protein
MDVIGMNTLVPMQLVVGIWRCCNGHVKTIVLGIAKPVNRLLKGGIFMF